jgi:AcrR family transcriptional regulator
LHHQRIIMGEVINSSKYQDICKKGKELFWKYGVKRVTIEEICREAGVSKMTFYKFFPNKIELAKTIFEGVYEKSLKRFKDTISSDLPFQDKVKEMIAMKMEGSKDISVEFLNDIYKNPELGLLAYAEKRQQESLGLFATFLTDAQKQGFIRKQIKIDFVFYWIQQMSHIMEDEQLVSKYDHPQDLIMELMNFMFYGLSPIK